MTKCHARIPLYPKRNILSIPISAIDLKRIPNVVISLIQNGYQETLYYVNAHCLNISVKNSRYRQILKEASLVYSGGLGPVLASKVLNQPLIERTPTPDFIGQVFSKASKKGWSVYFLGTKQDSLQTAVNRIKTKFPKLKICGYHHGFFSKSENEQVISTINSLKPTFVLVGMGTPKQELWMAENVGKLNVKAVWAVGALFDVISGELPRAPVFLQKMGLEWFFRLLQEPRRLWKRYLIGNAIFVMHILWEKLHIKPPRTDFVPLASS